MDNENEVIFMDKPDANPKQKIPNIQDAFLNVARKDKIPVTVFLVNGFQIKGMVKAFDSYVVLLESDDKSQMVYKHAISTVVPAKSITVQVYGS